MSSSNVIDAQWFAILITTPNRIASKSVDTCIHVRKIQDTGRCVYFESPERQKLEASMPIVCEEANERRH